MAVTRSASDRNNFMAWLKASKGRALQLLNHTQEISRTVFTSSDNLISFLDLTARIHHYDAYNLLLIWERCPSASLLAGFKVWERQLLSGSQVLKMEAMGNGIELVVPFTDTYNAQPCLVWYSLLVFDVSQTMLRTPPPAFDSGYIHDDYHEDFLLDGLKLVLGTKFNRSVIVQPPSQLLQEAGLPGQITQQAITVRTDLSRREMLLWLTEAMVFLCVLDKDFAPSTVQLYKSCVSYCLFRIWGLESYAQPPHSIQLSGAAGQELSFLHLVRDTVRDLNNLVCSCYIASRQDEDTLDDIDIEDLLGLP